MSQHKRTNHNTPSNTVQHFVFFALFLLVAFTWTSPFRDIFGLETRNAFICREMLEGSFTAIPTTFGIPYPDYPPLFFWFSTPFAIPFAKVTTFSIVLPSALAAIGTISITFVAGHHIHPRIGWLSALILATIPDFWMKAGESTIDMLLTCTITGALFFLYLYDNRKTHKKRYVTGAILCLLLAFFTKGPIGLVLPSAAWFCYLLLAGRFRACINFLLLLIPVVISCLVLEFFIVWKQGGQALVNEVINMQVLGRLSEKANKPIYYYFLCVLENTALWLILGLVYLRQSIIRQGLSFQHPILHLSIVMFVIVLTIFTIASTKHGRYILPLYPPLALVLATGVHHIIKQKHDHSK